MKILGFSCYKLVRTQTAVDMRVFLRLRICSSYHETSQVTVE